MLKVYLGGPMTGLTVKQAQQWRWDLMDLFVVEGIHVDWLNPVDQVELDHDEVITTDYDGAMQEVDNDIEMIKQSDVVVFNLSADPHYKACSVGSCVEIGIAHALGKPVHVVCDRGGKYDHPFVHRIAGDDTVTMTESVMKSPAQILRCLLNESIAVEQRSNVREHSTNSSNNTKRNIRVNINTEWRGNVNYQ